MKHSRINTDNLEVASVQDKAQSKTRSQGVSAGTGNSTINSIGISQSKSDAKRKEVVLTSVTGNRVNIKVADHTQLTGATIAATDEQGNDNGQLNLTTNVLEVSSLNTTTDRNSTSAGINISVGDDSIDNVGIDYDNDQVNSKTKVLATIGAGDVNITDEDDSNTKLLNRDITDNQVDIYNIQSHKGLHGEVDTRLLTEKGRTEIKQEFNTAVKEIYSLSKVAGAYLSDSSKNALKARLTGEISSKAQVEKLDKEITDAKKFAKEIGYDVDSMTKEEKIATLEEYANKESELTENEKTIKKALWASGIPLSDEWNKMRDKQITIIVQDSVKSKEFWENKYSWDNLTTAQKQVFLKKYNDNNNRLIGNTIETEFNVTTLTAEDPDDVLYGVYSPNENKFTISAKEIGDFFETIDTVVHEGSGHGYQDYVLENEEKYKKNNPKLEQDVDILDLSYNKKTEPSNDNYGVDPAEVDAWRLGDNTKDGIKEFELQYSE